MKRIASTLAIPAGSKPPSAGRTPGRSNHSKDGGQAEAHSPFVPPATHRLRVAGTGAASDYYFLLLPNTTMLAIAAAIEPLRVANQVAGRELYRWFTATESGAPVRCSNGIEIRPDRALADVPTSALAFVCSGVRGQDPVGRPTVNWLRRHVAHGGRVGSLGAGVFALAEAGLLSGRTFTMHWENQPTFREIYPDLEPSPRRYETAGGLLTCGGGYAATDMMLEIIERDHGRELALYVGDMCLHPLASTPDAPQRTAAAAAFGSRSKSLLAALSYMQDNLDDELRMIDIADRANVSTRHLERLFRRHVGCTPLQMLNELRVSRVYALLNETNQSVSEIAAAAGFASTCQLARKFRARFGRSPYDYRRGWTGRLPGADACKLLEIRD